MIRRLPILPTILVAAAVAVMIGLGVWQLSRAEWKERLIAQYRAAEKLPPIAFPTAPATGEAPLFRWATGFCLKPVSKRAVAGANRRGETGYVHIVLCSTGAEGPGMAVEVGWSKDPNAKFSWPGGPVSGMIGPDKQQRLGRSKTGDGQAEADRDPDEMNPPGRREGAVDDQRGDDQDRPDDQDQEGCGSVADVEAGKIEAAGAALVGEPNPAGEQGLRLAARAAAGKRAGERRDLPHAAPIRGSARPSRPKRRWTRTGTATRRRRSASTRRPPRSRNAASG